MSRQELENRAGLYNLLRALYSYPLTDILLDTLSGLDVGPKSHLAAGVAKMQSRLKAEDAPSLKHVAEELKVEMTRLFEGPGLPVAPPYASYYLHGGQLMAQAAVDARQFYLDWHALPEGEIRLPDDHIALELGFLAHLAQQAVQAKSTTELTTTLKGSREFIRVHLQPWLPKFCVAQIKASTDPFFIGLTHLLQGMVEADLHWLDMVTENPTEILSEN